MTRFLTLTAAAALFATGAAAQGVFQGDERGAEMGVTHSGSDHSEGANTMGSEQSGDWQSGDQSGDQSSNWMSSDSGEALPGAEQDDDDFAFNTDACSRPHYINLVECKSGGLSEGRASAQSDVSDPQEGTVGNSQSPGNSSGGGDSGASAGGGGGGGAGGSGGTGD